MTAYDASGAPSVVSPEVVAGVTGVTVIITVIDVNDAPTFDSNTPGAGSVADHVEDNATLELGMLDNGTFAAGVFTATDAEGARITLSLSGADEDKFEFIELDTPQGSSKMVAFKAKPDFEKPGDRNTDNIYEVTVEASDTVHTTRRSVTVKVLDADEEGKVTLSTQDAEVGTPLTATLTDSDGNVDLSRSGDLERVKWLWQGADAEPDTTNNNELTCIGAMFDEIPTGQDAFTGSATYTPEVADHGRCLRAAVWYMDRTTKEEDVAGDDDPGDANPVVRFINTAASRSTTAVRDNPSNQPPTFGANGPTTVRYVNENNEFGTAEVIGDPVMATDPDEDSISYKLGGTDEKSFDIDEATGQLETKARLDQETKDTYAVVVTAQDNSGAANDTVTTTVTIRVMDLDEQPVIRAGGLSVRGNRTVSYAENRTDAVETYTADGADAAGARWSLSGDDVGDFRIGATTGVLTFRTTPNYEAPVDADRNNVYQVTVNASSGDYSATLDRNRKCHGRGRRHQRRPRVRRGCDGQQKRGREYRGRAVHRGSCDGH